MFRTITKALRLVDDVVASVRTFATEVAEVHKRQAAEVLREGETFVAESLVWFQIVWARLLEKGRELLEAAEKEHRKQLRTEAKIRARRDREARDLYRFLLKARKTFEALGRGSAELLLGLDAAISIADPQVLLRYARECLEILRKADFELPPGKVTVNLQEHVDEIEPAKQKLEATMQELALQKRQTEKALAVKTQVLEAFRKRFTYTSRLFEALYVLAGKEFHSVRLRPPVGQRTGSPEEDLLLPDSENGEGEEAEVTEPAGDGSVPEETEEASTGASPNPEVSESSSDDASSFSQDGQSG